MNTSSWEQRHRSAGTQLNLDYKANTWNRNPRANAKTTNCSPILRGFDRCSAIVGSWLTKDVLFAWPHRGA
jgi:hypothetical protein